MKKLFFLLLLLPFLSLGQTTISNNLAVSAPKALDSRTGKFVSGAWIPWASRSEANAGIPTSRRYVGLTICLDTVADATVSCTEYIYQDGIADGNLVRKFADGGSGGGSSTFAGLSDKATADLPAINTPLAAALAAKASLNSPAFTGIPTAPTATLGTNTNQVATMAALKAAVDAAGGSSGGGTSLQLAHYWDFNDPSTETSLLKPSMSFGSAGSIVFVAGGTALLDFSGGTGQNFAGLNARNASLPGNHLRVNNPIGAALVFTVPTTGLTDPQVKFTTRRSGSGAGTQTWSYTTDGITYTIYATVSPIDGDPQLQTLDFSSITGSDDNANFKLKVEFAQGSGGTAGNNRIDNFTVEGTPITAPWAGAGGGGAGGDATWGDISGLLSNQADLQSALNQKVNASDLDDSLNALNWEYETPVFHTISGNYIMSPDTTFLEWDRTMGAGMITLADPVAVSSRAQKQIAISVVGTGNNNLTLTGQNVNGVANKIITSSGLYYLYPNLSGGYSSTPLDAGSTAGQIVTTTGQKINWNFANGQMAEGEWSGDDTIALTNAPAYSWGRIMLTSTAAGNTMFVTGRKTAGLDTMHSKAGVGYEFAFQKDATNAWWSVREYPAEEVATLPLDTISPFNNPSVAGDIAWGGESNTWVRSETASGAGFANDEKWITPGENGGVALQIDTSWHKGGWIAISGNEYGNHVDYSPAYFSLWSDDTSKGVYVAGLGVTAFYLPMFPLTYDWNNLWIRIFIDQASGEYRLEKSVNGTTYTYAGYTWPTAPNPTYSYRAAVMLGWMAGVKKVYSINATNAD